MVRSNDEVNVVPQTESFQARFYVVGQVVQFLYDLSRLQDNQSSSQPVGTDSIE
jgi:hypothetical protein